MQSIKQIERPHNNFIEPTVNSLNGFVHSLVASAAHNFRYEDVMNILPPILLILIIAGCASYHDGNRKGIFLKHDAPGTLVYVEGKSHSYVRDDEYDMPDGIKHSGKTYSCYAGNSNDYFPFR